MRLEVSTFLRSCNPQVRSAEDSFVRGPFYVPRADAEDSQPVFQAVRSGPEHAADRFPALFHQDRARRFRPSTGKMPNSGRLPAGAASTSTGRARPAVFLPGSAHV